PLMRGLRALLGPCCLAGGAAAAPAAPGASSGRREGWQMCPPGPGGTLDPVTATDSATTPAVTTDDIDTAARRIGDTIRCTDLQESDRLRERSGATVLSKREDTQAVRTYQRRGAYNLMAQLTAEERSVGVVAASAGNHAQGVAFACHSLGINGRIYVPANTPKQKRDRILAHGRNAVELVVTG